eukprot:SM000224S07106  [mRNA]  locus=s224:96059:97041:- [translate_table: standard]
MAQESWKRDQEETGCQPPEGHVLCSNNCGFFGSAATGNMCSKCYRDTVVKQSKEASAMAAEKAFEKAEAKMMGSLLPSRQSVAPFLPQPVDAAMSEASELVVDAAAAVAAASAAGPSPSSSAAAAAPAAPSPQPNRCALCKKRVGLTGFKCRCNNTFCSLHRYSDKHGCTFDYKGAGRDAIAKANPIVKADKVDKI